MFQRMKAFASDDNAATAIEYGMIAAFIALAIVGVLPLVGGNLKDRFQTVLDAFR